MKYKTFEVFAIWLIYSFICLILFSSPLYAGETDLKIREAAEAGLSRFLAQIPEHMQDKYGFSDQWQIASASLGSPLNLYEIDPDKALAYDGSSDINDLIVRTSTWYFPVLADEKIRCFLIVAELDGQWQAVSLGYANLAGQVVAMLEAWPLSKGYHPRLIVSLQAKEYFYTVPEINAYNLSSLSGQGHRMKNH